jgi:hypothetical protein
VRYKAPRRKIYPSVKSLSPGVWGELNSTETETFAMRSHLLLLGITSLALTACGGGDKNARMGGHLGQGFQSMSGACVDPLDQLPYQPIDRVEDLGVGAYTLVGFKAVGMVRDQSTGAGGISVVQGAPSAGRVDYGRLCSDFSSFPNADFAWNVSAPYSLTTSNPSVHEEISFKQDVISGTIAHDGAQVAPSKECKTIGTLFPAAFQGGMNAQAGAACSDARVFRLDASTVAVLRVIDTNDARGTIVRSKILAEYSTNPGAQSQIAQPMPSQSGPAAVSYHEENGGSLNQPIPPRANSTPRKVVKTSDAKRTTGYTPKKVGTPASDKIGDIEIQVNPRPAALIQKCAVNHSGGQATPCGSKPTVQKVEKKITVVAPPKTVVRVSNDGKTKVVSKEKSVKRTTIVGEGIRVESEKKQKSKLKVKVKN